MRVFYIVLICFAILLALSLLIAGVIGAVVANKSAKKFGYCGKQLLKATLLGIFVGNLVIVKNNFHKIEIVLDGENFYFQKNLDYTLYTSRLFAKELKKGYYKDTKRTIKGLDYELVAHYIFYLIKNKHAVDGSYLGTDYSIDKSAKLFEILAKFLP